MSARIAERVAALLGAGAVEREADGIPRAVPDSTEALARLCELASGEGWTLRTSGRESWLPADAPADLAVSTRGLDRILAVSPEDLVATVEAGVTMDALRRRLAEARMWLALDPPGRGERTIGSVVATATAGALRHGYGPVRDHVLGCTTVSSDGRAITSGGKVVKNVAGYDLTRLQAGGFGAFGIIATLHLRLRAVPEHDVTWLLRGDRDTLTRTARELGATADAAAAVELLSPAVAGEPDWVLALRFTGLRVAVEAETARLAAIGGGWHELAAERTAPLWTLASLAPLGAPVTLRFGVLADGLDELLDLVVAQLGEGLLTAGAASGTVRWAGDATVEQVRELRRLCAAREVPLTLERAPWPLRQQLGHFGAYREGIQHLTKGIRRVFDPRGLLQVAMEAPRG